MFPAETIPDGSVAWPHHYALGLYLVVLAAVVALSEQRTTLDQALRHDLASTITQHRGGTDAWQLAGRVLDLNSHHERVLGLREGCSEIVIYAPLHYNVAAYRLELDSKFTLMSSDWLGALGDETNAPPWVRLKGRDHWDWLHPRVRWVFEIG